MSQIVLNLHDPESFKRLTITEDDAKERLELLEQQQAVGDLSPRSYREAGELAKALTGRVDLSVQITRQDPSQFYFIGFRTDTATAVVRKFHEARRRLEALKKSFPNGTELEVLKAVLGKSEEMDWYRTAYETRVRPFKGLRNGGLVSLNLLAAARALGRNDTSMRILVYYKEAIELFDKIINQSEDTGKQSLEKAKGTLGSLDELYNLIAQCGPHLEKMSDLGLVRFNEIIKEKETQSLHDENSLNAFLTDALKRIYRLKSNIEGIQSPIDEVEAYLNAARDWLCDVENTFAENQRVVRSNIRKRERKFELPKVFNTSDAVVYFCHLQEVLVAEHADLLVGCRECAIADQIRSDEVDLESLVTYDLDNNTSTGQEAIEAEFAAFEEKKDIVSRNKLTLQDILDRKLEDIY